MATNKGFIKDFAGNHILPITRGELVLDADGNIALASSLFLAGTYTDSEGKGLPGLITAAERAMLSGGNAGSGISDIYNKLTYINTGLSFNGTCTQFYNTTKQTPINVVHGDGVDINISLPTNENNNTNVVTIGLKELNTTGITAETFVKGITVDKFGRVSAVSSGALTNDDIPATLSNKTLTKATLDQCTTAAVGTDVNSIVNKGYVDEAVKKATHVATGALKFGGPLSQWDQGAKTIIEETTGKWENYYYKVTQDFNIPIAYLDLDTVTESGQTDKQVKVGDTLIVVIVNKEPLTTKFVHIPSGDDITTITVKQVDKETPILNQDIGNITFNFSKIFDVTNTQSSKIVNISLPQASTTASGFLSADDFKTFQSYANNFSVTYTPQITDKSVGNYKLGDIKVGNVITGVYGVNNISSLKLINSTTEGENQNLNPYIQFTETGTDDVNIKVQGTNGIKVTNAGDDTLNISAQNIVIEQIVPQERGDKVSYLTITDGYKFGVNIGTANAAGQVTKDGLTDFSQFNALANQVKQTLKFELIDNSLFAQATPDPSDLKIYRYGNSFLKDAIAISI